VLPRKQATGNILVRVRRAFGALSAFNRQLRLMMTRFGSHAAGSRAWEPGPLVSRQDAGRGSPARWFADKN